MLTDTEMIQNGFFTVWDITVPDLIRHASKYFSLKTPVTLSNATTCINLIQKLTKWVIRVVKKVFINFWNYHWH